MILVVFILITKINMYERFIATLIQYMILIMMQNNTIYDTYNIDNDIDIDTEIINCISEKGFISRRDLTKYLIESHKDENGKSERGYTKPSIDRKIAKLEKLEVISIIKSQELKKFGIEETDTRLTYLISKESIGIKDHLDTVFKLLKSEDSIKQSLALTEIEIYREKYILDGKQLDSLVEILCKKNDILRYHLLRIICNHVIIKKIKPANEIKFLETLRALLKEYPDIPEKYPSILKHTICLLGSYKDKGIIDQLKEHAKNLENISLFKNYYTTRYCAEVIATYSTEFLYLVEELINEGKKDSAKTIFEIRYSALNSMGILKENDPNLTLSD